MLRVGSKGSRLDLGETRDSPQSPPPQGCPGRGEDRPASADTGKRDSQQRESPPPLQLCVSRGAAPSLRSHGTPHGRVPSREGRELRSWRRLCPPLWTQTLTALPAACLAAERPLSMSFPLSSARFSSSAFSSVFHSINPSAFRKQRKVPSALTEVRRVQGCLPGGQGV